MKSSPVSSGLCELARSHPSAMIYPPGAARQAVIDCAANAENFAGTVWSLFMVPVVGRGNSFVSRQLYSMKRQQPAEWVVAWRDGGCAARVMKVKFCNRRMVVPSSPLIGGSWQRRTSSIVRVRLECPVSGLKFRIRSAQRRHRSRSPIRSSSHRPSSSSRIMEAHNSPVQKPLPFGERLSRPRTGHRTPMVQFDPACVRNAVRVVPEQSRPGTLPYRCSDKVQSASCEFL